MYRHFGIGLQRVSKFNQQQQDNNNNNNNNPSVLLLFLGLIRIPSVSADFLITLNMPLNVMDVDFDKLSGRSGVNAEEERQGQEEDRVIECLNTSSMAEEKRDVKEAWLFFKRVVSQVTICDKSLFG
jgi:hypothetical protein